MLGIKIVAKGKSGAMIPDLVELVEEIRGEKPQCWILDIGTNDLASEDGDQLVLAKSLFQVAEAMVGTSRTLVVLSKVLPRTLCRVMPVEELNGRIEHFNTALRALRWVKGRELMAFWCHCCIAKKFAQFASDGVHLNNEGMEKYLKSVRRAVLRFSPT